ncbi:hypothetical protein UFOVP1454_38 [uncultured Caudovirales phage]|uniref:Uncharacterized protein n=1 Tax=uncultured Caudovirales phage TaxID=2100421 RepID=A0A6J5SJ14_9CAUD|nr:hypothetical protein UFOVP1454_38 [uncultured Caudovirales phage]
MLKTSTYQRRSVDNYAKRKRDAGMVAFNRYVTKEQHRLLELYLIELREDALNVPDGAVY